MMAAPVRSTRKPGRRPTANTRYVAIKMSTAVVRRRLPAKTGDGASPYFRIGARQDACRKARLPSRLAAAFAAGPVGMKTPYSAKTSFVVVPPTWISWMCILPSPLLKRTVVVGYF